MVNLTDEVAEEEQIGKSMLPGKFYRGSWGQASPIAGFLIIAFWIWVR